MGMITYRDKARLVEVLRTLNPNAIAPGDVLLMLGVADDIEKDIAPPQTVLQKLHYISVVHYAAHLGDLARNALHVLQSQRHIRQIKKGIAHGA
jgi:hypothetical protein